MIIYNMRFRGSYEYDKFVLNILQLSNLVNGIVKRLKASEQEQIYSNTIELERILQSLDDTYDKDGKRIDIGLNTMLAIQKERYSL